MSHRPFLTRSLVLALALCLLFATGIWAAETAQTEPSVILYFFWGDGCPHCAEAKPFLQDLARRYPQLQVESFEVYYSSDNQELFTAMAEAHGFEVRVVPTIFIGDEHWQGFAGAMGTSIERGVRDCLAAGCADAGAGIVPGHGEGRFPAAPTKTAVPDADKIEVIIFWGDAGCADCVATQVHRAAMSGFPQFGSDGGGQALEFLRGLEDDYPEVEVTSYEVWYQSTNELRFRRMAEAYGIEAAGVPTVFVGERAWEGFSRSIGIEIEAHIRHCLDVGCPSPAEGDGEQPSPTPSIVTEAPPASASQGESLPTAGVTAISLPWLGTVDLEKQSLWISTALISIVDGFNPCSLWVLSILIALSLRTGSRRRTFVIGMLYITVTAAVYMLFIVGLFTVLTFASVLGWIRATVAVLALFFAVTNIKDYFWYREGFSLTIADESKPGIYRRMRRVIDAGDSPWALITATVALGAGVSLVEFACTAGFPVIWTNLVASQDVAPATFALLLLLYMLIYQIDEIAIFSTAVLTLRASRLDEKHGRTLKLVGGMLMLALALVMLIDPSLMSAVGPSILVFCAALAATGIVLLVHRIVLPRLASRRRS
jgi:cytochrome c biogenesis protein CcdA/glutaredoxin